MLNSHENASEFSAICCDSALKLLFNTLRNTLIRFLPESLMKRLIPVSHGGCSHKCAVTPVTTRSSRVTMYGHTLEYTFNSQQQGKHIIRHHFVKIMSNIPEISYLTHAWMSMSKPLSYGKTSNLLSVCLMFYVTTYNMYMMTPVAQQSTGLPYRCLPTTSGAAEEHRNFIKISAGRLLHHILHWTARMTMSLSNFYILTQILWCPTGVFD